jgi:protein-L-isoaspartate(D-aspartate) O-methyltransferase
VTGRGSIRRERLARDLAHQGIRQRSVLDAMRSIPRDRFVDEALRAKAYSDAPLPIGEKQTISQPWIVARMTELLEPDGRGKVLEIGSGSGYHAAVLSRLFELVYSVERIASLSDRARRTLRELEIHNVHFKIFDGSYGWSEFAPFRAIVVTASVPELPQPLVDQLEEGGRIVLPIAGDRGKDEQILSRFVKTADGLKHEEFGPCRFVPLVGRYGWDH